jgi:RNA polymerase sigma-70 factor (ECF subfamily)
MSSITPDKMARCIVEGNGASSRPLFRSNLSQISLGRRSCVVCAPSEAVAELTSRDAGFDIEAIFRAQYERIARVIARVVRDRARAEELAVEVFLKLWRNERAQGENAEGWLYRVAVRTALDELRRHARRTRYESLAGFGHTTPTPEQIHAATEEQEKVRAVLATIERRQAELLLLRSNGLSYEEVADALELNPASVGTLVSRAQQAFRKEYIKRYGEQ